MRKIKLRGLGGAHFTVVDDKDYERVSKYRWAATKCGWGIYCVAYRRDSRGRRKCIHLGRLIMGAQPGELVDHIDRNPKNNQRSNLRFATHAQNMANSEPSRHRLKPKTSRFKGVRWCGPEKGGKGRWRASIRVKGKLYELGSFPWDAEGSAAVAYDTAARIAWGAFAWQNLPHRQPH